MRDIRSDPKSAKKTDESRLQVRSDFDPTDDDRNLQHVHTGSTPAARKAQTNQVEAKSDSDSAKTCSSSPHAQDPKSQEGTTSSCSTGTSSTGTSSTGTSSPSTSACGSSSSSSSSSSRSSTSTIAPTEVKIKEGFHNAAKELE